MSWLVSNDRVLASLEVADDRRSRMRGLLGRDGIEGALLIQPARWVHTIGMRFAIDVAYLDGDRIVLDVVTMAPHRLGRPRFRSRSLIEAEAGSFELWGLEPGMALEVRK